MSANAGLSMQDFLLLVVSQMQNQDMNSDQDNTQFMAQMAQMASMQAMQELTMAFMSSMSMSYIGKYVKASAYVMDYSEKKEGELKPVKAEGYAERVNFNGGEATVLINGTWFKVSDVYEVSNTKPEDDSKIFNKDAETKDKDTEADTTGANPDTDGVI